MRDALFTAMLCTLSSTIVACGSAVATSSTGASSGAGGTGATGATGGAGGTGGTGGTGVPEVCPGVDPWPPGQKVCRSDVDCTGGSFCVPAPIGGCGICFNPQHDCSTDADCASPTLVCEPYLEMGPCVCGSPEGTKCIPRCPDQPCAAGTQCSATGHCDPISCDQGYTCASDRTCKPGGALADEHGCVPSPCTAGFQCAADRQCDPAGTSPDEHGCVYTPCTKGFACAAGFECAPGAGADPHGCTPISCSKGNTCPVNHDCDPALGGQGCVQRKCNADSACDCGACVNGKCEPRVWICDSPPA